MSNIKKQDNGKTYQCKESVVLGGHEAPVNGISWAAGGDGKGHENIATCVQPLFS